MSEASTTITLERPLPWWQRWRTGDDYQEIEVEVFADYSAGTTDVRYLSNGDPGYPGDPEECEIVDVEQGVEIIMPIFFGLFGLSVPLELDDLTEDELEDARVTICEEMDDYPDYDDGYDRDDW